MITMHDSHFMLDTSTFQILLGEVDLMSMTRTDLLGVAATSTVVAVVSFVTDDNQTVIAAESTIVSLDWLKWVTEVLGASAIDATFTLHRTQLDEYGNEIGSVEVFNVFTNVDTGEDRIVTWFRAEDKQYFVRVSIIVAIYDTIPTTN